jgi:hypothetical protein
MRKSIIYLGIITVAFSNVALASNKSVSYQEDITAVGINVIKTTPAEYAKKLEDSTLLELNTLFGPRYKKSIEEEIIENNSIVDNVVEAPAYLESVVISNNEVITIDSLQYVLSEKTIDEIIAENNQIIDNYSTTEFILLSLTKTIDEIVDEDNTIIESALSTVIRPLDFDKINSRSNNPIYNKIIAGMN